MLTPQVSEFARRSVLCWLATVDSFGHPNVSPKEIFSVFDDEHLVIANIASPSSARNVEEEARVCVSFIDVFVQKGFKVFGTARHLKKDQPDFDYWSGPLVAMAGPRFPLRGIFIVLATGVEPIFAPSYRLYPEETTEEAQVESAMKTYGLRLVRPDA